MSKFIYEEYTIIYRYLIQNIKYKRLSWALRILVFLGARLLDSRCLHYLNYLSLKLYSKHSVGPRMMKIVFTHNWWKYVKNKRYSLKLTIHVLRVFCFIDAVVILYYHGNPKQGAKNSYARYHNKQYQH